MVEGWDAVVTSIAVEGKDGRKPTVLFSEGHRDVVAKMKRHGIRNASSPTLQKVAQDLALRAG